MVLNDNTRRWEQKCSWEYWCSSPSSRQVDVPKCKRLPSYLRGTLPEASGESKGKLRLELL